eukprot:gnl/TRDRNA2_/TRDRNA2_173940_c2_seq4.p1 gnl/TRDRNA2_/TRDRNA2_173940_c2~~gnl/TRDRNA2_/TRDRNA2_173940_c2_seq4.p1  ORF type:complete len:391 (-),score=54.07 gnl/TRDRNA2_/TRDRNA2_173940_c2_seq4:214-1260(-)
MDPDAEKKLSLGMFLANLNIVNTIGNSTGSLYKILMEIQKIFPALEKVTHLLNLPTDLPERKALNRDRRARTTAMKADLRDTMLGPDHQGGIPLDFLPIEVSTLEINYGHRHETLNKSGKMTVEQGHLVSVIGGAEVGKTTFLKILGGVLLPQPGGFFIPAHLRVLHVAAEQYFFTATLLENLTFGVPPDDPDSSLERVLSICSKLGLTDHVLQFVRQDAKAYRASNQDWHSVLSHTQKSLLMLARALISNPELLVAHKPTLSFDEAATKNLITLLREFVENKGVDQDESTRHVRRPRTCIKTMSKLLGTEMSDAIYSMSRERGIELLDKTVLHRRTMQSVLALETFD